MKTLFAFALCTFSLSIYASELPKDTVDRYIIDNVTVDNFDGTLLNGKTIDKYVVVYNDNGKTVEKKHIISTKKTINVTDLKEWPKGNDENDVHILLDGKEISSSAFGSLKPEDIANITVLKPRSSAAKAVCEQRGYKDKKGVVMIFTDKSNVSTSSNKISAGVSTNSSNKVIYINGKRASEKEMSELKADGIASMTIRTKENATEVYIVTKAPK